MVEQVAVRCCVVGGGPAGMMLSYLLARGGVDVLVLERHADFLRDFRGDTMHPSTLEIMHELGLLGALLAIPHQRIERVTAWVDDDLVTFADFTRLATRCKFGAILPQWDFLNFLGEQGVRYGEFELRMQTDVTELVYNDNADIAGVRARTSDGHLEVRADLVVGCDGRSSVVREQANLSVRDLGSPVDVCWFRLSRRPGDPTDTLLRIERGRFVVLLGRLEHWQCGFVIPKDGAAALRARGLAAMRREISASIPFLADRVDEIASWEQMPMLTVRVDRLERWYRAGLLCIGDAAHAMSPIGAVGINLAIQDAVATANILAPRLRDGTPGLEDLRRVQRRRSWPARGTQRVQVLLAKRALRPVLDQGHSKAGRFAARVLQRLPRLARITGRAVGVGLRAEHVQHLDR